MTKKSERSILRTVFYTYRLDTQVHKQEKMTPFQSLAKCMYTIRSRSLVLKEYLRKRTALSQIGQCPYSTSFITFLYSLHLFRIKTVEQVTSKITRTHSM